AHQIPSDEPQAQRFEHPLSLRPQYAELRFYTFPGGCATYRFKFQPGRSSLLAIPVDSAVGFVPRSKLVTYVRTTEDLALCGRGAPCPGWAGRPRAGGPNTCSCPPPGGTSPSPR